MFYPETQNQQPRSTVPISKDYSYTPKMTEGLPECWLPAIVTVLVYMLNARSGIAVGEARKQFNVPMPRTQGPLEFERVFRAHANNAEQYPQFVALMWVFSVFVNANLGGALGVLWVILRHLYVSRYHKTAEKVQMFTIPAYMILSFYSMGTIITIVRAAVVQYL